MAIEPIENTELIAHSTPPLSMIKMSRQWFAENRQRLLKFAGVGITGVVVNLMIFELCFGFLLTGFFGGTVLFNVSNGLAILVSIFTNFLLNDLWTWGDRVKGVRKRDWLKRITKYYLSASLGGVVQFFMATVSLLLLWEHLPVTLSDVDLAPRLSVLTGIACGMVINFTASHLWAFRDDRIT